MILMRAIKPTKPFQSSIFRDEVKKEADAIRKDILDDFQRTTKTWKDKPVFASKVDMGADVGGVRIQVATDDPIYGYVDEGTRPHDIYPKRKRALAFQSKYKAKTQPNVILSTPGGASGDTLVRPHVHHPGTKARHFVQIIKRSYAPEFQRRIKNALERAARRFNHA